MADLVTIIGTLAVIMTATRLLPQIIKTFRTKKVRDISLLWEIMGITGAALWLAYAYLRSDLILGIGTGILVVSYSILILQNFMYDK